MAMGKSLTTQTSKVTYNSLKYDEFCSAPGANYFVRGPVCMRMAHNETRLHTYVVIATHAGTSQDSHIQTPRI